MEHLVRFNGIPIPDAAMQRKDGPAGAQQPCNADSFAQIQRFTGSWVASTNDSFNGFYTMTTDCPTWARDYDCKNPQLGGKNLLFAPCCHRTAKRLSPCPT